MNCVQLWNSGVPRFAATLSRGPLQPVKAAETPPLQPTVAPAPQPQLPPPSSTLTSVTQVCLSICFQIIWIATLQQKLALTIRSCVLVKVATVLDTMNEDNLVLVRVHLDFFKGEREDKQGWPKRRSTKTYTYKHVAQCSLHVLGVTGLNPGKIW